MKLQVQVLWLSDENMLHFETKSFPLLFLCCYPLKTLCYFCLKGSNSSNRPSANIRLLSRIRWEEGEKTTDVGIGLMSLQKLCSHLDTWYLWWTYEERCAKGSALIRRIKTRRVPTHYTWMNESLMAMGKIFNCSKSMYFHNR